MSKPSDKDKKASGHANAASPQLTKLNVSNLAPQNLRRAGGGAAEIIDVAPSSPPPDDFGKRLVEADLKTMRFISVTAMILSFVTVIILAYSSTQSLEKSEFASGGLKSVGCASILMLLYLHLKKSTEQRHKLIMQILHGEPEPAEKDTAEPEDGESE